MSLVELARYATAIEAELVRIRLETEGVAAIVFDSGMNGLGGATPCRVMVGEEDLAAARRALADRD